MHPIGRFLSKHFLRIAGIAMLGFAVLAGSAWNDGINQITPISRDVTLQKGKIESIEFTPLIDSTDSIDFTFDQAQQNSFTCKALASSIQLSILKKEEMLESGTLSHLGLDQFGSNQSLSCRLSEEGFLMIGLSLRRSLALNQKHFIRLSIVDETNQITHLKFILRIVASGIDVHYALINLEVLQILIFLLLITSLGCFSPDIYKLLSSIYKLIFRRQPKKPLDKLTD